LFPLESEAHVRFLVDNAENCNDIWSVDLGPEFVYEALRTDTAASAAASGRTLRFLANVDPTDVARALSGLDAESTLVIIVSKTFTTAETMLNAKTVKKWLLDNIRGAGSETIIRQHMAAVR
jgi:glucose-6-phosphate isomerase